MERTNNASLNGRGTAVLEAKPVAHPENHTNAAPEETTLLKPNQPTEERAHPETQQDTEKPTSLPPGEGANTQKPKRGLPKWLLPVAGVGAIVAGGFGYNWWQFASTHQETDDATVAGHVHQISSRINGTAIAVPVDDNQQVHKGDLLVKLDPRDYEVKVQQAQAALEAAQRQAGSAQANIALSSETTQGKTSQAQGDINAARAGIATAQAAVQEAKTGIPAAQAAVAEAQAGIPAAQAQVAQAEANLVRAQADYNRYETLYRQGAVARQQLDTARATYLVNLAQRNSAQQGVQQAQARLAQAKQGVAQAQAKLAQAQEGVANAQAKLAAAQGGLQQATAGGQQTQANRSQYEAALAAISQSQANLNDAKLQLSYTNVTAPTDGRVGRKTVEVGQQVQPGQALMAIVDNEDWVVANFKETQLEKMRPGQEVEVKLDAFPHHPFKGRVDSFSPGSGATFALLPPDNATGNFTKIVQRVPVKIVLDSQSVKGYESRIVPGMSAVVSVDVK
jgi:membrane fusion protein (multidrug efflux system)